MTPSPLTLKLKEAFQLHENVNLRRYLITLLSSTWHEEFCACLWVELKLNSVLCMKTVCIWKLEQISDLWTQPFDPICLQDWSQLSTKWWLPTPILPVPASLLPLLPALPFEWWALFSLPLNLSWPGNLLSSIEWGGSYIVPDPSLPCFSSVQALSHYAKGPSYPREAT